jgi:hypothetical protein
MILRQSISVQLNRMNECEIRLAEASLAYDDESHYLTAERGKHNPRFRGLRKQLDPCQVSAKISKTSDHNLERMTARNKRVKAIAKRKATEAVQQKTAILRAENKQLKKYVTRLIKQAEWEPSKHTGRFPPPQRPFETQAGSFSTAAPRAECLQVRKNVYLYDLDSCHIEYEFHQDLVKFQRCLRKAKDRYDACCRECRSK